ncbi:MAG: hypothetical protein K0R71_1596 [Bacillales bacterium]|jgi:glycosyltransferase involved in cell wall biosynthesis|nr:hypothetical protein [Bacillales bacterium]
MKKILLIRDERSFLPEISAYLNYFNNSDEFRAYDSRDLHGSYDINDFDVLWEFKGFGGIKTTEKCLVHEYVGLSSTTFPHLKDTIKRILNPKPNLRIFLNETVRDGMNFKDGIDYSLRDMGIDPQFIEQYNAKKEYDFVYVGKVGKYRGMDHFLKHFTINPTGKLLLIGNVEDDIYRQFKNCEDIIFAGRIPYSEVPELASKAEYGLNYMPDEYPFNIQTSTKLLEYLALGLKVITTDYPWVRDFEKKHQCNFYKIDYKNPALDLEKMRNHHFHSAFKPEDYMWDQIMEKSLIKKKLLKQLIG